MLINHIKLLKAGVALLVAMGSLVCCERQELDEPVRAKNAVSFSSGVYNAFKTRASGDSWSVGDEIGIFMVNKGQTTIAGEAANKKYVTEKGNGDFLATSDDEIFYPDDGTKVDFIAYYPYQSAINTLGTYSVNVSDQSDPEAIDLLYAKANNNGEGYDESRTTPVDLVFRHQLARLRLVVINTASELGISIGEFNNMTAEITGLKTTATFNLADGALGNKGGVAPVTLRKIPGGGAAFDALVIPDAIAEDAAKVTFTVGEETFEWTLPATTFESGKANSYQILLKEPPPIRGAHVVSRERVGYLEYTYEDDQPYRYVPTKDIATQPGDYVFVFAHTNSRRADPLNFPIAPEGYSSVRTMGDGSGTSGGARAGRLAYRIATGETTELGQWENTNGLVVLVVRGVTGVGNTIAHNGSGVAGNSITFNAAGLDHGGASLYTLVFVTGRESRYVTGYNTTEGFNSEDYTAFSFTGDNPTFWAAISKYANTSMPPLQVIFSANSPRLLHVAVALESDDPVAPPAP